MAKKGIDKEFYIWLHKVRGVGKKELREMDSDTQEQYRRDYKVYCERNK